MRRAALLALALAAGCSGEDGPIPAVDYGRQLFADARFSDSEFNEFSCATCHSTRAADGRVWPGYSLADSAFRPSFWGGYEARLFDAVSFCAVFFMRAQPLDPTDARGRALYEYLVSISPDTRPEALPLTVVANITSVSRGSATRGKEVWDQACRVCHGDPRSGRGRLSDLVSIVPETSEDFAAQLGLDPDLVLVEKVRHGQFFGVGGNMPLFSREALSDADLGALLGYLDAR